MTNNRGIYKYHLACIGVLLTTACFGNAYAKQEFIPTGMTITPTAARGAVFQTLNPDLPSRPDYVVDHAIDMATSPDGNTLLILTSGYNRMNNENGRVVEESNEYVFIYDMTSGNPIKKQVLQVPNTFNGIAWNPNGKEFYVSDGVDDNIHVFSQSESAWKEIGTPIALEHNGKGEGLDVRPMAAGLSVNSSGTHLLVANYENDSISLVDLVKRSVVDEFDLRPGIINPSLSGTPGGTFPFAVKFKGDTKAYATSQRDREIIVIAINDEQLSLVERIKTEGQPNKMTMNKAMSKLFVASDNDDSVLVVDTDADDIIETIPTIAPKYLFRNKNDMKGANPNYVALSPDEGTLLVTNGGTNSVAVIQLGKKSLSKDDDLRSKVKQKPQRSRVVGLIPTGWYPSAVTTDGRKLYVINAKGVA